VKNDRVNFESLVRDSAVERYNMDPGDIVNISLSCGSVVVTLELESSLAKVSQPFMLCQCISGSFNYIAG
jgi:hypothetical protein